MQERFVGIPEEGGRALISTDPLAPGSVYTAVMISDHVALHRIEVSRMSGNGKLRITGNPDRSMKQSLETAYDYIALKKVNLP